MRLIYGCVYRCTRRLVILITRLWHFLAVEKHHLETAVLIGDRLLELIYPLLKRTWRYRVPSENTVKVYDLEFRSPLTFSSFKYHETTARFWLGLGLGGGCLKTILNDPRPGNPKPRIQEFRSKEGNGLLNALGLPGPGIQQFSKEIPKWRIWTHAQPIGISVGGNSIQEYLETFKQCHAALSQALVGPYYIELNISCPNTPEGQQITRKPELLKELLFGIRQSSDVVCSVKASPDQTDEQLLALAEICTQFDKIMINCGNTQYKSCEDLGFDAGAISIGGGGMSGDPLFKRTCEMVSLLRDTGLPIMATGGISTPNQVLTVLNLGASLIGMATVLVKDPFIIPKMNDAIAETNRH